MATYNIKFTDINKTPIIIDQGDINTTAVDIALFGRIKLEYGELLDENILHLLENFACPENAANPGNPDLTIALADTLSHPTSGQVWYNSTQHVPFVYNGTAWIAVGNSSDFAANWGKICDDQQLPLPLSSSGYEFKYSECIWMVSPSGIQQAQLGNSGFSYMSCTTNDSGLVTHKYAMASTNTLISGIANYVIIGMRNSNSISNPNPHNHNYSNLPPPPPPPPHAVNPTITPTVTSTPLANSTVTPTPSANPSVTPTLTMTPTLTGTPTVTRTPTVTPSVSARPPLSAILYISPTVGYAQQFGGPAGLQVCNTTTSNPCKDALTVWVANIAGGAGGPYSIKWDLNYFYSAISEVGTPSRAAAPINIYPSVGSSYNGSASGYNVNIAGTIANLNGGNGLNANAYCQVNFLAITQQQANNGLALTVTMTILAGSKVTIIDSANNSITYYVPGGSYGQVMGTQLTAIPSSNYTDQYPINAPSTL